MRGFKDNTHDNSLWYYTEYNITHYNNIKFQIIYIWYEGKIPYFNNVRGGGMGGPVEVVLFYWLEIVIYCNENRISI